MNGFFAKPSPLLQRFAPWIIVAVALVVLLPGTATIPLIDRDEPRFASATREMMHGEHANWVVPYFNGEYRFDKPILIYWMMRASYAAFGINEFSARLPSVLCAIALALLLYRVGKRWFSTEAGLLAGVSLITCVQLLMHGRSAVADMPMVLAIAIAQFAAFDLLTPDESLTTKQKWKKFFILYFALGLGFLAKGPIALVVPLVTILFYRFVFWRQKLPWKNLHLLVGAKITLFIIAAWGIPALLATHGLFFKIGVGEHVVERGSIAMQGHGGGYLYYLGMAFLSLCPWIACAGQTAVATKQNWNAKTAFLVSWLAATYLLFTLYVTKLPHYVLPAFPAFFLLLGLLAQTETTPRWSRVFFWIVIALFALIGLVVPPVLGATLLVVALRRNRFVLAAIGVVVIGVGMLLLAVNLRATTATMRLLPLFQKLPEQTQCAAPPSFREPSLVFYSDRHWNFTLSAETLPAWMNAGGPRLVVCAERETKLGGPKNNWKRVADYSSEIALLPTNGWQQVTVEGFNIGRASWVRLHAFYRP